MRQFILFLLWFIGIGASPLGAQPKGAPCDYGYRPGNTWFYRSTSLQGGIYSETVSRDSVGTDRSYWTYLTSSLAPNRRGTWYRIDSACVFDRFIDPSDWRFEHWFLPKADTGDWWVVDSVTTQTPLHARVVGVYQPIVFGKSRRSKEILYYPKDSIGDGWYSSEEWAEGLGVIRIRRHPNGYDEIIGAIIDGVSYGVTTSVDERSTPNLSRLALWPLPAASVAMLQLPDGAGDVTVSIVDMNGAERYRESGTAPAGRVLALDVSGIPAGTYIAIADFDGRRLTAPLVVAR